jgi:hypothetical protein
VLPEGGRAEILITVELFGVPRLLAGIGRVDLSLPPGADLRAILGALAVRHPRLAGDVVAPDGGLIEGYVLNLDGREFVRDLGRRPRAGDRILLLAASAGG